MVKASEIVEPSWQGQDSAYPRMDGLAQLFMAQVEATPDAWAVQSGAVRMSYRELAAQAARIAHALAARCVGVETPVGVLIRSGPAHIVVQVACAMVGATCVPLDPEYPRERLRRMIAAADVWLIVSDDAEGLMGLGVRVPGLCLAEQLDELAAYPPTISVPCDIADKCAYILYTSGSTGQPKGIAIVGRAINRLVLATDYVQIEPGDHVAQIASFTFDAALFEVWGPLLNGATLVQIPRPAVLDPVVFVGLLQLERVTVMFLTTALFNFTVQADPRAFVGLRCLLIGGERVDPKVVREVLMAGPPQVLLNAYGPTESTTFATAMPLTLADVAGPTVTIGRPIRNTFVYVVDDDLRPVGVGEPGELCIGGDGLARGYVGLPELTAQRFVTVAGVDPSGPVRVYRTGDRAQWRRDGTLEFLGRRDFQVKVRGHRIELEEVEAALIASELLTAAVVVVEKDVQAGDMLVAHIVPRTSSRQMRAALQQYLRTQLPGFMIPGRFHEHIRLPMNAHGKVDRAALRSAPATAAWQPSPGFAGPVARVVVALWAELLGTAELAPEDDFFDLGGDSMRAARLILRVREDLRITLPFATVYAARRLDQFIAAVQRAHEGADATTIGESGPAVWRRDARLPADIMAAVRLRPATPVPVLADARVIVVTGATGFLGSFVVHELLRRTQARLWCLVRAHSPGAGIQRIAQTLQKYGLWSPEVASRVVAIPGDLDDPLLGLGAAAFAELAAAADHIFHVGAKVNYVTDYAAHYAANVAGTREVIRLAAAGRAHLHHVSTIAVFGPTGWVHGTRQLREDEDLTRFCDGLACDIGYSQSKWVAEQLVWAAASHGLPVTVHRPGFIMGDSVHGYNDAGCSVARLLRGCIRLGAYPELPHQRKELVTVDYVSAGIVAAAARPDARGHAFHWVPPELSQLPDITAMFEQLAICGYPLCCLPYSDWIELLRCDPDIADNPLCPLLPVLSDLVAHERTAWELYERMPHYDTERAQTVVAEDPAVKFTPMTPALLRKHLGQWRRLAIKPPGLRWGA